MRFFRPRLSISVTPSVFGIGLPCAVSGAAGGTGDVEGGGERVVRAAAGRLGGKSEGWGQRLEHWARWGHRCCRWVRVREPSEADRAIRECEKPISAVPHELACINLSVTVVRGSGMSAITQQWAKCLRNNIESLRDTSNAVSCALQSVLRVNVS